MMTWFRSAILLLLIAAVAVDADAQMRKGKLGVGLGGSIYMYTGEYSTKTNKMGGGLGVAYNPFEYIGLRTQMNIGQFGYTLPVGTTLPTGSATTVKKPSTTTFVTANLYITGHLMPNSKFNPFISAGAGWIYFDPVTDDGIALSPAGTSKTDIDYFAGGGFDVFLSEFLSVSAMGEMCFSNTDRFDGAKSGSANDSYMRFGVEVRYYFFDQGFMTKMLEALKARYE
jgi:hypothetical protein